MNDVKATLNTLNCLRTTLKHPYGKKIRMRRIGFLLPRQSLSSRLSDEKHHTGQETLQVISFGWRRRTS
jgi:hypothetical protein